MDHEDLGRAGPDVELSIVLPCLNEERTLGHCIDKARAFIDSNGIAAEIIVADNGSTDASREIARRHGARVVDVPDKGYGAALSGGIYQARGQYIIMGDADDSYDFSNLGSFLHTLRQGADLVMGCRFPTGGGRIMPGAMPWKHRYIGNPVLSFLGRKLFRSNITDFHCGLRGFTKAAFHRMHLVTTGMEFASEMVIKATLLGLRIAEVPITLYKDGRDRPPHLRSWRDGWRHLRFMLIYSPGWLFLVPGAVLMTVGGVGCVTLTRSAVTLSGITLDTNSLLVSAMSLLVGYQLVVFYLFTKTFSISEGLLTTRWPAPWAAPLARLEYGVILGFCVLTAGTVVLVKSFVSWGQTGFGPLSYPVSLRQIVPAVTLILVGVQTIFSSFFLGVLGLRRRVECERKESPQDPGQRP